MATTNYYMLPLTVLVQYFTNAGLIAAGGTITTQVAGSVSTLATTYTDSTGLVANPNPLTLNSAARPANTQSGAQTGFWVPQGTTVDVYFTDALGETWSIKNMAGINDPSSSGSLQTTLASPTSSNTTGSGPVAGVDLVANAMKSYDVFNDVRAANSPVLASGQTLNISVQGGTSINDGLGGDFYWNATSTAADNGATVLRPNSVQTSAAGRWLRLYTPQNFGQQSSIAAASYVELGSLGSNFVLITGTGTIGAFGTAAVAARPIWIIQFQGACTLTASTTVMNLPGGASINTAAGDVAIFQNLGNGNWTCLGYFRAIQQAPIYLAKTANQSVTSSTTLTGDTALITPNNLVVGATYLARLRYQFLGTTTTTQGYKAALVFTGTITGNTTGGILYSNNLTAAAGIGGFNAAFAVSGISDTTPDVFNLDVVFTVATAGQLVAEFAQNTSSANAVTALANSSLEVIRIA